MFCAGFSAHGVVALKYDAADPELHLEDTDVCPRHMAVCDGPNWARVGFVLRPFLFRLCWQKLFSIKSEFMYPGLILIPCPTDKLHKDKNP